VHKSIPLQEVKFLIVHLAKRYRVFAVVNPTLVKHLSEDLDLKGMQI